MSIFKSWNKPRKSSSIADEGTSSDSSESDHNDCSPSAENASSFSLDEKVNFVSLGNCKGCGKSVSASISFKTLQALRLREFSNKLILVNIGDFEDWDVVLEMKAFVLYGPRCQGPFHSIYELTYKRQVKVTSSYFNLPKDRTVLSLCRSMTIWDALRELTLLHYRLPMLFDSPNVIVRSSIFRAWQNVYTWFPTAVGLWKKHTVHMTMKQLDQVVRLLRANQDWSVAHCLVVLDFCHLFSNVALKDWLDELNDDGDAPVHLAMKLKRLNCVKALIAHGARLDVLDKWGNSPFHFAATLGMDYMDALAPYRFSPLVNMLNDRGESPLYLACVSDLPPNDLLETVFMLLRYGSDPNMAMYGEKNCAPPSRTAGDLFGTKALTRLSRFDTVVSGNLFQQIYDKYYDEFYPVEIKYGGNPLHWIRSRMPVLDLVRASCLLEARNFEGDTPIHMAVHNGHLDVCSALIGYGANLNVRDLRGNTPLHIAVKYPSLFMTMLLICAGANVNLTNFSGISPLHVVSTIVESRSKRKNLGYVLSIMGAKRCPREFNLKCGRMCAFGGPSCDINVLKARCTLAADSECDEPTNSDEGFDSDCDSDCGPMRPRRQFDQVISDIGNAMCNAKLFREGCKAPVPSAYQYFRPRLQFPWRTAAGDNVFLNQNLKKNSIEEDMDELVEDEPDETLIKLGTEVRETFKDRIITVPNPRGSAKILCLDGGGIRGLITLQILMCIEEAVGHHPLNLMFDWICGTSTGAFLALLVASGMPARDILRIYLNTKDRVFTGTRPYDMYPLEETLKLMFGPYTVMSDFNKMKVFITATLTDRFPAELHLFRNYDPPNTLLGYPLDTKYFKAPNNPDSEYIWFAAQASAAAPTYFKKQQGVYCDGGLVANNPTLDLLTELWEWNVAVRASNCARHRVLSPTLVLSLGTGLNIMEQHMDSLDIDYPDSVGALLRTVNNLKTLLKHVVELSTTTDFQVGDRARAWCGMTGVPYFRFNPTLFNYLELNETQDGKVVLAMFETRLYMMKNEAKIKELVQHMI